jgi:hypothetical protein
MNNGRYNPRYKDYRGSSDRVNKNQKLGYTTPNNSKSGYS